MMLEYGALWLASCAVITGVGGLAYMADKAMARRMARAVERENIAAARDSIPAYPRSEAGYHSRDTMSLAPELIMCGGCGRDIEPGACPVGGCNAYKKASKNNLVGAVD